MARNTTSADYIRALIQWVSIFNPTEMFKKELEVLSVVDLDEYYVEKIVAHEEKGKQSQELVVQGG